MLSIDLQHLGGVHSRLVSIVRKCIMAQDVAFKKPWQLMCEYFFIMSSMAVWVVMLPFLHKL